MAKNKIITHALLKSWSPCCDGFKRFKELFPKGADLHTACEGLRADGHLSWAEWLFDAARWSGQFKAEVGHGFMNTGNWNTGDLNTGNWNTGDRNTGNRNTGNLNTGDRNTGNWNTGNLNTGNLNTGNRNTGNLNTGDRNTGNWNTGNLNTGNLNTGNRNTGNLNTGDRNTGDRNTGDWNTGDWNTGDLNTGNWNTGDRNTGFFNTITPEYINVFNKPCERSVWESSYIPAFLFFSPTVWVSGCKMTDQEKIDNQQFHVAGGYLKEIDYKTAFKASWDRADKKDREKIKDLPNFDAALFFEISGIDVNA